MNEKACIGCLLGTAAGDSLGLPYEGMSPRRASRMFPNNGRHQFLFGKGMVSGDTEHACFSAQALINARGHIDEYGKRLAWSLRWSLLGLPAGVGFATLIGVALGSSDEDMRVFVRSTQITHSDPKAIGIIAGWGAGD